MALWRSALLSLQLRPGVPMGHGVLGVGCSNVQTP